MRNSAIRLLTLALTTTMLAGAATIGPAEASAHHGKPIKRHQARHPVYSRYPIADQAWRGRVFNQPGDVCPGSGRSFECKIWPPPMDQDPDRKMSGTDGG